MFESAEVGHRVDPAVFEAEEPALREALLNAQYEVVQQARFPVVILVSGVDGAGKGETVNLLNEWMDPRHMQSTAFTAMTDEERERPPMWRFWRALPPKGKVGILFGSWYTAPIVDRVNKRIGDKGLGAAIDDILDFERMLVNEGVLVIKIWFHLSKEGQRQRLKRLEKDPDTRWRVTAEDWENYRRYDKFREVSTHVLRQTNIALAPWYVVEGTDPCYRALTAGKLILEQIQRRLQAEAKPISRATKAARQAMAQPLLPRLDERSVLSRLDLSRTLSKKDYLRDLEKYQGRLNLLVRSAEFQKRSLVVVFEGMDAAGKGGAIRRITSALDARNYRVVPIAAPTEEERAQPYLWRFWRHVPRRGRVTVFDRSWYGRVLVERVEGFSPEADWMRGYAEINRFEAEMVEHGAVVVKFWLQITSEEQLRRFEERSNTGFKRYKITEEDWRNREKWPQYDLAVNDMVERTGTEIAPWVLVEANDKRYARIKVLKTLCDRLEKALGR